jgi:hypothetical protein
VLTCGHSNYTDLRHGKGDKHLICHVCGRHWYKDREWTRAEWDAWINSPDDPEPGELF